MTEFKIGDRVKRVGPHIIWPVPDGGSTAGLDYGDKECSVGSVGTVVQLASTRGAVIVRWDEEDGASCIVSSSLAPVVPTNVGDLIDVGDVRVGDTVRVVYLDRGVLVERTLTVATIAAPYLFTAESACVWSEHPVTLLARPTPTGG